MRGYQKHLSTVAEVRAQRPRGGSLVRSTAATATVLRRMWLFLSVLRYPVTDPRRCSRGVRRYTCPRRSRLHPPAYVDARGFIGPLDAPPCRSRRERGHTESFFSPWPQCVCNSRRAEVACAISAAASANVVAVSPCRWSSRCGLGVTPVWTPMLFVNPFGNRTNGQGAQALRWIRKSAGRFAQIGWGAPTPGVELGNSCALRRTRRLEVPKVLDTRNVLLIAESIGLPRPGGHMRCVAWGTGCHSSHARGFRCGV
jgi:hypothetical protein